MGVSLIVMGGAWLNRFRVYPHLMVEGISNLVGIVRHIVNVNVNFRELHIQLDPIESFSPITVPAVNLHTEQFLSFLHGN